MTKRTRWVGWTLAALAALGLLSGGLLFLSHQGAPVTAPATILPTLLPSDLKVVAVVNGVALYPDQISQVYLMDGVLSGLVGAAAPEPDELLSRSIHAELVTQAALRDGYIFPETQVTQTLTSFLSAHGSSREILDAALSSYGVTSASFLGYYRRLLTVDAFSRQAAAADDMTVAAYVDGLRTAADVQTFEANLPDLPILVPPVVSPSQEPAVTAVPEPTGTRVPLTPTALSDQEQPRDTVSGAMAPDFSLMTLDDVEVTWGRLVGRPVVLSFWVSWCSHCRAQTPALIAAYEQYADAGVEFVGINVKESAETARAYVAAQGIPYEVVLDIDGAVALRYHVVGLPTTYFLDSEGRVAYRHVGELSLSDIDSYISEVLGSD